MSKTRNFVEASQWRQAIKILDGEQGLLERFEQAMEASSEYLPSRFDPMNKSQKKLEIYALACRAAVGANVMPKVTKWCDITCHMDPENVDALIGRGERLLKDENWEEAVRVLNKAFDNQGKTSQDVGEKSPRS